MKMIFIHSFVDVFEGMRPEDILHSLRMNLKGSKLHSIKLKNNEVKHHSTGI